MNIQKLLKLVTIPLWRQRIGDIATPEIVINSMLSHLSKDPIELIKDGEIILDPCCGHGSILIQIANRIKEDIDPMVIAKHLWGYDIKHAATARKLLANELGIDPKYVNIYEEDSLKVTMNIKNFRVVMNPPFNEDPGEKRDSAGNSNNSILYQEFVNKFAGSALQVVSLNPAGWTIKTKEVERYKKMGLKHVEFLPANHFPTVTIRSGLTISNFLKDYNDDITVTTQSDDSYIQSRSEPIRNLTVKTKNILQKLHKFSNLSKIVLNGSLTLPKGTKGNIERAFELDPTNFSLTQTAIFKNKTLAFVGDGKNLNWVWTKKSCAYANQYKVVVSSATSKHFLGNVITVGPGIGVCKNNTLIIVQNDQQAKLYKEYLDGPLVKFIIKNVKFNDVVNTKTNSWNYIPLLPIVDLEVLSSHANFDLTKEIYKLFDLSSDDQAYIESN
jgi:hypothetical protein